MNGVCAELLMVPSPDLSRHLLERVLGDTEGPELVLTALWLACPSPAIVHHGNLITKHSLYAVSCPGCWRAAVNKTIFGTLGQEVMTVFPLFAGLAGSKSHLLYLLAPFYRLETGSDQGRVPRSHSETVVDPGLGHRVPSTPSVGSPEEPPASTASDTLCLPRAC